MFKIFLLIAGLAAVAPDKDGKSITVILIDSHGGKLKASDGETIPEHFPRALFSLAKVPASKVALWRFEGEDMEFSPAGAGAGLRYEDKDRLIFLGKVLDNTAAAIVEDGCMGAKPKTDCLDSSGNSMVAGRIILTGDIVIRPLELTSKVTIDDSFDQSLHGFRTLSAGNHSKHRGNFKSGILASTPIAGEALAVVVGGEKFELEPALPDECRALEPGVSDCFIVRVSNFPEKGYSHKHGLDRDFELIYNLLENKSTPKLLPYSKRPVVEVNSVGPTNPPGSKCFSTILEPLP